MGQSSEPKELKAAIVDQLALTEPNPSFAEEATRTLQGAGYTVDYYPGEQVTVDFYRDLPTHKYDLLVLRAHTARFEEESLTLTDPVRRQEVLDAFGQDVFFFTAELYDRTKYAEELEKFRLFAVRYRQGGDEKYFGVTPHFIESSMRGSFGGATIIMMGCDGLLFDNTPRPWWKGARRPSSAGIRSSQPPRRTRQRNGCSSTSWSRACHWERPCRRRCPRSARTHHTGPLCASTRGTPVASSSASPGGGSTLPYAATAGAVAGAVLLLAAGGWYARRRYSVRRR